MRAKESLPMQVGSLVITCREIPTLPVGDSVYQADASTKNIPMGTVGIIIQRPDHARPRQFLVNFVGGREWWMYHNEIQPYIKNEANQVSTA